MTLTVRCSLTVAGCRKWEIEIVGERTTPDQWQQQFDHRHAVAADPYAVARNSLGDGGSVRWLETGFSSTIDVRQCRLSVVPDNPAGMIGDHACAWNDKIGWKWKPLWMRRVRKRTVSDFFSRVTRKFREQTDRPERRWRAVHDVLLQISLWSDDGFDWGRARSEDVVFAKQKKLVYFYIMYYTVVCVCCAWLCKNALDQLRSALEGPSKWERSNDSCF